MAKRLDYGANTPPLGAEVHYQKTLNQFSVLLDFRPEFIAVYWICTARDGFR